MVGCFCFLFFFLFFFSCCYCSSGEKRKWCHVPSIRQFLSYPQKLCLALPYFLPGHTSALPFPFGPISNMLHLIQRPVLPSYLTSGFLFCLSQSRCTTNATTQGPATILKFIISALNLHVGSGAWALWLTNSPFHLSLSPR